MRKPPRRARPCGRRRRPRRCASRAAAAPPRRPRRGWRPARPAARRRRRCPAPRRRDPEAREAARAAAEGHRVELAERQPGLGQAGLGHRQQGGSVAARRGLERSKIAAGAQRDRAALARGVQREDLHPAASSALSSEPDQEVDGLVLARTTAWAAGWRGTRGRSPCRAGAGSHTTARPASSVSRISRPMPCFRLSTACGSCTSRKGSRPASRARRARLQQRVVGRRERQLVDQHHRQRRPLHVDAFPEALRAEQHGVAQPPEAREQARARLVALHQHREAEFRGARPQQLRRELQRAMAGEQQEGAAAARLEQRQRDLDDRRV
jgi:hypothetical protein